MSLVLGILAVLVALAILVAGFLRLDAARLASALRATGPMLLIGAGVVLVLIGRAGIGGMLVAGGLSWLLSGRRGAATVKSPGQRSTVRTAALEMELDHDSGGLDGVVLAGSYESRRLSELQMRELLGLYAELKSDSESRQLLETYLDGRFPVWRADAQANGRDGKRVAPGSGAMTKEEAYKVLGLEAGATAADIRKAHRRLMQRLHPDLGGTSFLAARINEAKDVLLTNHS